MIPNNPNGQQDEVSNPATSGPSQPVSSPTVIIAGNLWDGKADSTLGPMQILVDKDLIIEMGKNVSKPAEAKIVDLSNYTVTPGLLDHHVHLGMSNL